MSKKILSFGEKVFDTCGTNEAICPYCGRENFYNLGSFDDDSDEEFEVCHQEVVCSFCFEYFYLTLKLVKLFYTRKKG